MELAEKSDSNMGLPHEGPFMVRDSDYARVALQAE